jgi:hypothetical protein
MTLEGKGFFIWKIKDCESGNPQQIAAEAQQAGFSHILIKVANGIYSYNYDWDHMVDLVPPVAQALKAVGIQVWGWHYVYGDDPINEARIAISRVQGLGLDGYVIDAESEYKESGKATAARQFMSELRSGLGSSVPVALSSYRYPSLHPIPWSEFLAKCDYTMPQVYWMKAHNSGAQLIQTIYEYENLNYHPPMIPVGAAFTEQGWAPTSGEILEFMDTARAQNLSAVNFYEWYNCREVLTPEHEIWNLIASYDWGSGTPQPQKDITEQYIDALNTHDVDRVVSLYDERAVHVTSTRTIFGKAAIRAWYETLMNQLLPNGLYLRTGFSGSGSSRHFTWVCQADTSDVLNGNDTLGLYEGKIGYHFTYFSVS